MKLTLELTDEIEGEVVLKRPFVLVSVNGERVGLIQELTLEASEETDSFAVCKMKFVDYSNWAEGDTSSVKRSLELLRSVPWLDLEVIEYPR